MENRVGVASSWCPLLSSLLFPPILGPQVLQSPLGSFQSDTREGRQTVPVNPAHWEIQFNCHQKI